METLAKIENIINICEKCKNAYFWTPGGNRRSRSYYEDKYTSTPVEWDEGGHHYSAWTDMRLSGRNAYFKSYFSKDGKRTTLTAVRNSAKRIREMLTKSSHIEG